MVEVALGAPGAATGVIALDGADAAPLPTSPALPSASYPPHRRTRGSL
jgi:hypothetical protein